jgi:hypothetical protein
VEVTTGILAARPFGKSDAAKAAIIPQPRRRRDRFPVSNWNLPLSENPTVFAHFSIPLSLEHMKNTNQKAGGAPGASETKQEKKGEVTKLPRMEMYAVLGLELSKTILEKLVKVEESLEILARQKARELNPDKPPAATGE